METVKVAVETAKGNVELEFTDLQQAMERMSAANLETLRRWTRSLELKAEGRREESSTGRSRSGS